MKSDSGVRIINVLSGRCRSLEAGGGGGEVAVTAAAGRREVVSQRWLPSLAHSSHLDSPLHVSLACTHLARLRATLKVIAARMVSL